uniref:Fe2OG dioxygenase domain-containing protein n=1 Tax=Ananas comosus var. bracteatus TaxID=296719 RepID=A0A6V7PZM4_ANACO|nr:unnamed protein product [Ananas comosus var. bracteatus]
MNNISAGTCEPPLIESYEALLLRGSESASPRISFEGEVAEQCELPLIDLADLRRGGEARRACAGAMARAASEWGFFQVVNHGISARAFAEMRREQKLLFRAPFEAKVSSGVLNNSYRWGNPTATSVKQFLWSEAFHVSLAKIPHETCSYGYGYGYGDSSSLGVAVDKLAAAMSALARTLAGVLAENLGYTGNGFPVNCDDKTCFLRLNRYPPCPFAPETFGLMPHTDSDFLTVLHQDHVGGLHLMKDSEWVAVAPNPDVLVVNIGDLFQAWSNDTYKSVEHKVIANKKRERYSIAYFLCPSYDSPIGSCQKPSLYKDFTFGEFREQVQDDVKRFGYKVGLPRFLL